MAYPQIENDLLRQRELLRAHEGNKKSLAAWQEAQDGTYKAWHVELFDRLTTESLKMLDTQKQETETKRKCWTEAQRDVRKYYTILWHREQVKLLDSMGRDTVQGRRFKTKWVDPAARDVEALTPKAHKPEEERLKIKRAG